MQKGGLLLLLFFGRALGKKRSLPKNSKRDDKHPLKKTQRVW